MRELTVSFKINGCQKCPFSYPSHYRIMLFCRFNQNLSKGAAIDHDLSEVSDYPTYCPWIHKKINMSLSTNSEIQ